MMNTYSCGDPIAIAAAMTPELVSSYYEKDVKIETTGELTKGLMVVNWFGRKCQGFEGKNKTKIVMSLKFEKLLELLIEAVM